MLHIKIEGKEKTGKTSVAAVLRDFLELRGFTVTLVDQDLGNKGILPDLNKRLAHIAVRSPVTIETKTTQAARTDGDPT